MGRHEGSRSSTTLRPVDAPRVAVVSGDDDSLRIELIGKLIAEAEPMVAKLDELVSYYEVRGVNQLAHALSSLAGDAGAVDLQDAALRLEAASARTGAATSILLEAEMDSISRALECIRLVRRSWWARAIRHAGMRGKTANLETPAKDPVDLDTMERIRQLFN